jgi:UPF0716 family protein affecting phage T7 exclusion
MWLLLALWMCTLPVIGLLVVPLFGLRAGFALALVLLILTFAICWGLCRERHFHG